MDEIVVEKQKLYHSSDEISLIKLMDLPLNGDENDIIAKIKEKYREGN